VFRSFPLRLCGAGHHQSGATLNGNPKGRATSKMGFPFAGGHSPHRKFIRSEGLLFSFLVSFIDRKLFCFPPIFPFFLSSDLRSGILLFPFLFFLFISSFSFFSFFFFRFLIGNSGFNIRYSLSLEEILLSSSSGERMRILFIGQGSK